MKRILTKLLAVLVPCLLVIGSIGFACMADEAEAETVDTTVETEQEQPEEQNDDAQMKNRRKICLTVLCRRQNRLLQDLLYPP